MLYHIDLQLTLMQRIKKGKCYQLGISCHGNGSRSPLPNRPKHRNKGYFDQKDTVLIPNVTQFVQKTNFIANKVRKFQLIDDWQNYV